MSALTIALVGRPNVGKSTLFNRLIGKQMAIVDDQPGVTRDYRSAEGEINNLPVTFLDTAGWADDKNDEMALAMTAQTERALSIADVAVFVVDGIAGLNPVDGIFAKRLRKLGLPVILVVNKCDSRKGKTAQVEQEFGRLGFDPMIALSAAHGSNVEDLAHYLGQLLPEDYEIIPRDDENKALRMAIVGRPNAGKSTLLNAFIGEHRVLVSDVPGTTRDPIAVEWRYQDKPIRLVDTAGLRRKARITDPLEKRMVEETLRIIRLAEVVVLVVDATQLLDKQDLLIAQLIHEEGRPMVLAVNKWDLVTDKAAKRQELDDALQRVLPQVRGLPVVTLSALKGGKSLEKVMDGVLAIYKVWNIRISTGKLNVWLNAAVAKNPPPLVSGRPNKIRYMTQIKARPPTFAIFLSKAKELPDSYERYLTNGLRERFDLNGVPIRVLRRKNDNPYVDDKK